MRRLVLVVPGLFGEPGNPPSAGLDRGVWRWLIERSTIRKVMSLAEFETPEWAALGVNPEGKRVPGGPILISAMKLEPPPRDVLFQMTLMSLSDGVASQIESLPSESEIFHIGQAAKKLETSALKIAWWKNLNHGLVWANGSLDLGVKSPDQAVGKQLSAVLPEGDGEPLLRQFIDDSVNLLSDLELNHIRREEGQPELNLLLPWDFGLRPDVPNLAIQRGEVRKIMSSQWRVAGLARWIGDQPVLNDQFRQGMHPNWAVMSRELSDLAVPTSVWVTELLALRSLQRLDEIEYSVGKLASEFLEPLLDNPDDLLRLAIIAPGVGGTGLTLSYESWSPLPNSVPFDERALEDRRLSEGTVWAIVESTLNV